MGRGDVLHESTALFSVVASAIALRNEGAACQCKVELVDVRRALGSVRFDEDGPTLSLKGVFVALSVGVGEGD